ncbi:hypothetical protein C1645_827212 [Glomus cerebriforme]|uniref:Uncharacterized protein n=1 Tax=Glomus cerebriforme TaxID=658196 RepID=A0A397SVG1_9GLOM|nr:hypothetical protein C1645_827212 [Glomus cerebriforme]
MSRSFYNQKSDDKDRSELKSDLDNNEKVIINEQIEQDLIKTDDNNSLKKLFKEKYNKMEDDWKWKLSCMGHIMEDVIYKNISNFVNKYLLHSFIIDVNDLMITGIFFPAEIDKIESTNIKKE